MKYDSNLYLISSIRARVAVLTNAALALSCAIAGFTTRVEMPRRVLLGSAVVAAVNGMLALRTQEEHTRANADVADLSDQIRTNTIYQRLTNGDTPSTDYSAQLYNYIVMELGRGCPKDEVLMTLDRDREKAVQMWDRLESQYGKLPAGDY